jgi:hypothetical protein
VRYLEDCIAQLKAQNGCSTPTLASRRESDSVSAVAPHSYAASSSGASEASHTDTEMTTAPPPTFAAPSYQQPSQQQQQQPSLSPPPPPRPEDFQRTYSFSHSAGMSPAFGPQVYAAGAGGQWLGSAASSALTSPALGPMAEEETATVALMMLNGDWRMGEQKGDAGVGAQRPRGMSVKDLLST